MKIAFEPVESVFPLNTISCPSPGLRVMERVL